jgi:hypothetical protein
MVFFDWLSALKTHEEKGGAELDITDLHAGDVLRVGTMNTLYTLRVIDEDRTAELETDRADRPAGQVKIVGCTFGLSSTIRPNHLFCGGSLELSFVLDGVRMTHTTSSIRTLQCIRRAAA